LTIRAFEAIRFCHSNPMPSSVRSYFFDAEKGTWTSGPPPLESASTRISKFGDGIFESCLYADAKILGLILHVDRLQSGLDLLGLETPLGNAQKIMDSVQGLIEQTPSPNSVRIRLQISRLGEGAYTPTSRKSILTVDFQDLDAFPWQHPATSKGLETVLHPTLRTSYGPLSAIKSSSSLLYVLAAQHAQQSRVDECILLSQDSGLSEASGSNLFLRHAATLITPNLNSGCLPGTMRMRVIQAAQKMGIDIQERHINPQELHAAEEVFLTNAIHGIRPISFHSGISYPTKERILSQALFSMLMTAY